VLLCNTHTHTHARTHAHTHTHTRTHRRTHRRRRRRANHQLHLPLIDINTTVRYQLASCCWTVTSCCHGDVVVVSDRTQQPLSRTSLTPDKLHPKVNSLVIQADNVEKQSVDFGMVTAEIIFKRWDASKSSWSTGSCKVLPRLTLPCHHINARHSHWSTLDCSYSTYISLIK